MSEPTITKKKSRVPHTYVILFTVIIIMAILTYIIPAGEYDRMQDPSTGRTVVDPDSFHGVEQNPATPFDLVQAVPKGMNAAAGIIFFIFIIGGAFQIIAATGAIEAGISRVAVKLEGKDILMIPIFTIVFSIFGGTIGMAEETIVFVPIGIALARALGYDALVGTAMVTLGAASGFTSGFMNPFTVGVAQGISELPLFSGIGFRFVILGVMLILVNIYLLRYAKKVKNDPEKSIVRELEIEESDHKIDLSNLPELTSRHIGILLLFAAGLGVIIYGVFELGWYITEIATVFLAMGIVGGFVGNLGPSKVAQEFVVGARGIVFGALVVGIARGILVVMTDGFIIDSIIHGLATGINALPTAIAVLGMYIVQVVINFFIPSGSGQAAATMPIMAPLADVLNINRQVAVTAFQFGDGITNSIIPTSAALMGVLSVAKIPYEKWFKFVYPVMLIWISMGAVFLLIAHFIDYGPF